MTHFLYISCNILNLVRCKSIYESFIHITVLILIYVNQGLAISWGMPLLCLLPFLAATTDLKLSSQPQFLGGFVNLSPHPIYLSTLHFLRL